MLFNSVFSAYDYSYVMSVGWSPSIFPPLNLKELFQKLEYSAVIDNRCCCCQELVSPPFVSFPIFFLSARVFFCFASFLSCLVSYSYIFLPSKLSFSHLFPHLYFPASATYIPFLPWGISTLFFFCISTSLPVLLPSLPSAFRYAAVFAALPADPGRGRPAHTPTAGQRSRRCPAAHKQLPGHQGLPLPTQLTFSCLSGTKGIVNSYRRVKPQNHGTALEKGCNI